MNAILDFIVRRYIGTYLTGWHTKMGSAITTLLGLNACILALVQSLMLAQDGQIMAALHNLNGPEMLGGLGALGITKMVLGVANKQEKLVTGELAADVAAKEATLPIEERAATPPKGKK